jgi:hypothetical protein
MNMEEACLSETSAYDYKTTLRHNPVDHNLYLFIVVGVHVTGVTDIMQNSVFGLEVVVRRMRL